MLKKNYCAALIAIMALLNAAPLQAAWTQTSSAEFNAGSSDGHTEVVASGGGAVRLAKLAGTLGAFQNVTPLPQAVAYSMLWTYGNRLYTAGGFVGGSYSAAVYSNDVDASGNFSSTWTPRGSLPMPHVQSGIARWADRLYIGAGSDGTIAYTNTLRMATLDTSGQPGTWTSIGPLPQVDFDGHLVAAQGKLFFFSGNDSISYATNKVYSADIRADGSISAWTAQTNRSMVMRQFNASYLMGKVFISGGENSSYTGNSNVIQATIDDQGAIASWTNATSLPAARSYLNGTEGDGAGKVYILGGKTYPPTTAYASVYSAPVSAAGTLGAWTTEASLPAARMGSSWVILGGKIHYLGGSDLSLPNGNLSVYSASLNQSTTNAPAGSFVGRFDLGSDQAFSTLTWGSNAGQYVQLQARIAPSSGIFGSWTTLTNSASVDLSSQSPARYIEYRAKLSDDASGDVELTDVTLNGPAPTATASPTPTPTAPACLFTQTTRADFLLGGNDGQVAITSAAGGGVRLQKKAGALGAFVSAGTGPWTFQQTGGFSTDDYLYIVSGFENSGTEILHTDVMRASVAADGSLGPWTNIGNIPTGLGQPGFARWADRVYVGGGNSGQGTGYASESHVYSASIDANGDLSTWRSETSLPQISYSTRLYAVKGRLYTLTPTYNTIWSAPIRGDGSLGSWVQEAAGSNYPFAATHTLGSFTGDRLWVFGRDFGADVYTALAGDGPGLSLGAWASRTSLPVALRSSDIAGAGSAGKFYVMGGAPNGGANWAGSTGVYSADVTANGTLGAWTTESSLPANRVNGMALYAKGFAYYLGGFNGSSVMNTIYRASLNQGSSNAAAGSFVGRFDIGSVAALGSLEWNTNASSQVQMQARIGDATGVFGAWSALAGGGSLTLSGSGRYVEYRAQLTDGGAGDVELQDVTLLLACAPTSTPTPTQTPTPTPVTTFSGPGACPVTPGVSLPFSGVGTPGDILMTANQSTHVFGFDPATETYYSHSLVPFNIDGGLAVDPADPGKLRIVQGANLTTNDANGTNLGTWGTSPANGLLNGAFAPDGSYWVLDQAGNRIFRFPAGGGAAQGKYFSTGSSAPSGAAFDNAGNLYVTDALGGGGRLLKVAPADQGAVTMTTTVLTTGIKNGGQPAFDGDHSLFIGYAPSTTGYLGRIDLNTGINTVIATTFGSLSENGGGALYGTGACVFGLDGALWVAINDSTHHGLLKLTTAGTPLKYYPYPATIGGYSTTGLYVGGLATLGLGGVRQCTVVTPSPTATPSATPWGTPTMTVTPSRTPTPSATASPASFTFTRTPTPSSTASPAPFTSTSTSTRTATPSFSSTRTQTPLPSASRTPTPTSSQTPNTGLTPLQSATPSVTATSTRTPTVASNVTPPVTVTPVPSQTCIVIPVHTPGDDSPHKVIVRAKVGGRCSVKVYRPEGRICKRLWEGQLQPSEVKVLFWDNEDEAGQKVASGIYIAIFQDGNGAIHKSKVAIIH